MSHWIEKSNIYHIYPLGFCGCERTRNESSETPVPRIRKVIDWIPYLKDLNFNAVYFGPVFESVKHGYDTIDYKVIDRRLGTNADFKDVCDALHKNGIRVILDGVLTTSAGIIPSFWTSVKIKAAQDIRIGSADLTSAEIQAIMTAFGMKAGTAAMTL